MPRLPIDYSRCLIYKLCCNDPTITDEYYGHTTDKIRRKIQHKYSCNNPNKYYNSYVYQFIRENGGWENWSMIVVEEYPCENKNQAEVRERFWIETQQSTLNKVIPTRTKQEWCEEHKEEILEKRKQYYDEHKEEMLEKRKQYYDEHKEEIREQRNQPFDCECGGSYTNRHKSRHMKTQKHLKYLDNLNVPPK
jgi:hypothetical protein